MRGRASKWLDHLKRLGTVPTTFTEFCTKFLEQLSVLGGENMAQDKFQMA